MTYFCQGINLVSIVTCLSTLLDSKIADWTDEGSQGYGYATLGVPENAMVSNIIFT